MTFTHHPQAYTKRYKKGASPECCHSLLLRAKVKVSLIFYNIPTLLNIG
jgi:hypothetical protein